MSYKMEESEVRDRLERIKRYNAYHTKAGQPHHCTTRAQLAQMLVDWGHDPKRANGIAGDRPPSPFLQRINAEDPDTTEGEF